MKKYLMNFEYAGFLFSAKVFVKRENRKMLISTQIVDNQLTYLLGRGRLLFLEDRNGFQLLLCNQDRTFEILKWEITEEYVDQIQRVEEEAFSLS
jgi:hypothetical protein